MPDDIQLPRLPAGFSSPDDYWLSQIAGSSNRARCIGDIEEYGRACVLADREGRGQPIYGYHIVSEINGNGVAFCTAEHAEEVTAFMMAYPNTTIVPLVHAPADARAQQATRQDFDMQNLGY